jgi:glyoxylase-like metal-dependent hydrolase (beta-lactamase superfamily II)
MSEPNTAILTPAADLHSIRWIQGAPDCRRSRDPALQAVAFDEETFVLRQSMCVNFEAPFMYLIFGKDAVLLHDTGATASPQRFPIRQTVDEIIARWLRARGRETIRQIVTHSHGHGDHVAGDGQFSDLPAGSIAPTGVAGVSSFFEITNWPLGQATIDLGDRVIDVLPGPGHFDDHIFVFDRSRGLLLTGDSMYPGLLVVRNWAAYDQSIRRLAEFCRKSAERGEPVTHVLGAHIEMTNRPGVLFDLGVEFHPDEHPLPLPVGAIYELDAAVREAGDQPREIRRNHFVVQPFLQ